MLSLENKIEAVLLFKNEPISVADLSKWLGANPKEVKEALESLRKFYEKRGMVIIFDGEQATFGTHPEVSELIQKLQKEEFSSSLTKAALETLSIVLYRSAPGAPVTRREIDHIRGVNSGFILRSLLIRGLVERVEPSANSRSYGYQPTLKLLEHLGVTRREDLPRFDNAFKSLQEFIETTPEETSETDK
jgi:segregation and condensation protein B